MHQTEVGSEQIVTMRQDALPPGTGRVLGVWKAERPQ